MGVRLPSVHHDSSGSGEAVVVARHGSHSDITLLAAEAMVPRSSRPSSEAPSASSVQVGPSVAAARLVVSPKLPHASASCLATIERFARTSGFSAKVAGRLGHSRCLSSVTNYQAKWSMYCHWREDTDHSVSNPTVSKVAYYPLWLWKVKKLSVSSIKVHRSILSTVFRFSCWSFLTIMSCGI